MVPMSSRSVLATALRTALAGVALAAGTALAAATGGFSATLPTEAREAAGLTALTAAELAALDQLVTVEVRLARQQDLQELRGTFATRRTAEEWTQAGLDRLTPAQLAKLNALVAAALAARPQPRERPRLKDQDVLAGGAKPELHGSVSLGLGWASGGRSFRTTSFDVDYFDPVTGLEINVGYSTFKGDGFLGYYPGYYGPYDAWATPYDQAFATRGTYRDSFDSGTGSAFRGRMGTGSGGRGGCR